MDALLKTLLGECPFEYILLNTRLRITRVSNGAGEFGDVPAAVTVGADVREAFPEFVGMENHLATIASTSLGSWRIRNLSRHMAHRPAFVMDITVQPVAVTSDSNLLVLLEDVSKRATLEQRLVQSSNEAQLLLDAITSTKEYYEQIIESIADALIVLNPEGNIRTLNSAAAELFGQHKGELLGCPAALFFGKQNWLEEPLHNKELTVTSQTDESIPVAVSSSLFREEDARDRQVILVARDLREKKKAESEIDQLRNERVYLREELDSTYNFQDIIGKSNAITEVFKQIEQVAQTDATVLLLGETGTGKELIARAIHNLSGRREKVMVKVNCAALPASLIESELFGHEKGAFTGAAGRRIGRFEFADGGTLFLDEIAELGIEMQAKLLRVLQEQEFERVGGTQPIKVNVRVVAATNQDIERLVADDEFRRDLFFRINVFPIRIPALRNRREDIPLLAQHFVSRFSKMMNKSIGTIHPKAIDQLLKYDWPGNVRELSAVIERAVILSDGDVLRTVDGLSASEHRHRKHSPGKLLEVEREHILSTLNEVGGIIEGPKGAALRLGLNPSTLRSKMKKLGIKRSGQRYT